MISDIYLKELIKERTDIVEYAVNNYDVLKNNSDNRNVKKYSVCKRKLESSTYVMYNGQR